MSGVNAIVVAYMEESGLTLHSGPARLPADRRILVARTAEGAMGNFEKLGILVIIVLVVVILVLAVWGMGVPPDELDRSDLGKDLSNPTQRESAKKGESPHKAAVKELPDKPAKPKWWVDDPNKGVVDPIAKKTTDPAEKKPVEKEMVEPAPVKKDLSHTVAKGENLSVISRKYYGHDKYWRTIQKANPSVDPGNMQIGAILVIPNPEIVKSGASPRKTTTAKAAPTNGRTYTARKGDTLSAVASKMLGSAARWRQILDANRDLLRGEPRNLRPGMVLTIP
jgi:nucleoid-associated protein YgaU